MDLSDAGLHLGALALLEQARALSPDDSLLETHLGTVLVELGRLDDAEGAFRGALAISPRLDHVWNGLGRVMLLRGYARKAALCFEQSVEVAESVASLSILARAQLDFEPALALQSADRALGIDPTWVEAQSVREEALRLLESQD
jgi:Flp pilus assembly protein TadD